MSLAPRAVSWRKKNLPEADIFERHRQTIRLRVIDETLGHDGFLSPGVLQCCVRCCIDLLIFAHSSL